MIKILIFYLISFPLKYIHKLGDLRKKYLKIKIKSKLNIKIEYHKN